MTLSKASLGEALGPVSPFKTVTESGMLIRRAAGFVERLLPAKCVHGETKSHQTKPTPTENWTICTGQVWDEGLIEVVAVALWNYDWSMADPLAKDVHRKEARAVLAALTAEVGK